MSKKLNLNAKEFVPFHVSALPCASPVESVVTEESSVLSTASLKDQVHAEVSETQSESSPNLARNSKKFTQTSSVPKMKKPTSVVPTTDLIHFHYERSSNMVSSTSMTSTSTSRSHHKKARAVKTREHTLTKAEYMQAK